MNPLSWFLYFADVIPRIGNVVNFFGIIGFIGWFVFPVVRGWFTWMGQDSYNNEWPGTPWYKFRYLILAVFLLISSAFFPSKNTLYAIAVSQVGEKIATTQAVQGITDDATKALQSWIHNQINPEPEKKKD